MAAGTSPRLTAWRFLGWENASKLVAATVVGATLLVADRLEQSWVHSWLSLGVPPVVGALFGLALRFEPSPNSTSGDRRHIEWREAHWAASVWILLSSLLSLVAMGAPLDGLQAPEPQSLFLRWSFLVGMAMLVQSLPRRGGVRELGFLVTSLVFVLGEYQKTEFVPEDRIYLALVSWALVGAFVHSRAQTRYAWQQPEDDQDENAPGDLFALGMFIAAAVLAHGFSAPYWGLGLMACGILFVVASGIRSLRAPDDAESASSIGPSEAEARRALASEISYLMAAFMLWILLMLGLWRFLVS